MTRQFFPTTRQFFHAIFAASVICSAHAMPNPLGFNKIVCLTNSDTIVGVPFRIQGSLRDLMAGTPGVVAENPDLAVISLQSITLTPGALDRHYLKFEGGPRDGRWYDITANTATSVTIDLNGDTLDGVDDGNPIIITEYWTLDTLFPPDQATTSWTENPENPGEWIQDGHAIVVSTSRFSSGRRSELLLPDLQAIGTNIAPNVTFYVFESGWRKQGVSYTENYGSTQLNPDSYFIVRQPEAVPHSTIYRCAGEVEMNTFVIPLMVRASLAQDNAISLPRPVDMALDDLGLVPGAFVASTSRFSSGRKDELLVFNHASSAFNKAPDRTYYYYNSGWRKQNESYLTDFGPDTIPAGAGLLVRKASDNIESTVFWKIPEFPILAP